MHQPGRKLSSSNYRALTARDGWRRESPQEAQVSQRTEFAVIEHDRALDDVDSPFFTRSDDPSLLTDDETRALDALMERVGLRGVLDALQRLCDSRVDETFVINGRVMHHLARADDYAHASERLRNVLYDDRVRKL